MKPDEKEWISEIFRAALMAVDPYQATKLHTERIRDIYLTKKFKRLLVIGFGKAAHPMAMAIEESLGDLISKGMVITKYGHRIAQQQDSATVNNGKYYSLKNCRSAALLHCCTIFEAGHPLPDENGLKGTGEIIKTLKDADENTLVVCLVSGGGSALLISPCEGISLIEKQKITELLLKAGADINELNTVRKHISRVKGGRLAEIAYPAKVISLILSDVIGDRLDIIASGPTAPDRTTFKDALYILQRYNLINKVPENILKHLKNGAEGLIDETPKEGSIVFQNVENIIIGSNAIALNAAKSKAQELGLESEIITKELRGEAKDAGRWLAKKAKTWSPKRGPQKEVPKKSKTFWGGSEVKNCRGKKFFAPTCLISGGETTVTVKGNGTGGRNMELALAFAMEIEGIDDITLLSAGTDGTDGPTDAAGAIVNGNTVKRAREAGLDPIKYLENNDTYNFFNKTGGLLITGPTGTNVMDIQIVVIE